MSLRRCWWGKGRSELKDVMVAEIRGRRRSTYRQESPPVPTDWLWPTPGITAYCCGAKLHDDTINPRISWSDRRISAPSNPTAPGKRQLLTPCSGRLGWPGMVSVCGLPTRAIDGC